MARSCRTEVIHFPAQGGDLRLEGVVFSHFPVQEANGDPCLFLDAFGRQQVGVDALVRVATKTPHLDQALIHKSLETIIGFAQADAHGGGQLALGALGVLREELEQLVSGGVVEHGLVQVVNLQVA